MSYSDPTQFRSFVDRKTSAGARSANQWGQTGTEQDDQIQLALDAGFNDLNAAAQQGGYTVPVTQVGLGVSAEVFAGVLAWLQICEMALASESNMFPIDQTPQIKATWALCGRRLEMLMAGTAIPSALQGAGGGFEYVSTTGVPTVNFEAIASALGVDP